MIPSTTNSKSGPHTGNGLTTTWDFAFKVFSGSEFSDSNIRIILTDANGVETDITSNYSTTLNANQDTNPGGTLNYPVSGAAITSSNTITITSNVPITQGTDYQQGGVFNAQTVEDRLDWLTLGLRQLSEIQGRSLRFPISINSSLVSTEIPIATDKILSLDENGNIVAVREMGTFEGVWEAGKGFVSGDMVKATTTLAPSSYSVFWCKTNHTSSGAMPLDTNADYAKWEELVDAQQVSLATAQAVAASDSATLANNWAVKTDGVVSGSDFSAKHYALAGAASATTANTANTGAETAKTAAETAKTAAETTYIDFRKFHLGAKSSLPTTDNNGGTLLVSAKCFLTTDNKEYLWDGSVWKVSSTPVSGPLEQYTFTATSNQTDFSGNDDNGKLLVIDDADLVSFVCYGDSIGFGALDSGDYTIDQANNKITLTVGADAGKKLSFIVFGDYSIQSSNFSITGNANIGGTVTANSFSGNGANLTGIDAFPSGTVMVFYQASAPTGWTKITDHNDKALRVVSGAGGGTGGSTNFSTLEHTHSNSFVVSGHTLSIAEIPAHNHGQHYAPGGSPAYASAAYNSFFDANSGLTSSTGGGGSHTHGLGGSIGSTSIHPKYVDIILCGKD